MKVLVVGNGGREHALAWKLARSERVTEILIAPGNAGTASIGENVPVKADDVDGLLELALERGVDLTIVGPEAPMVAGIANRFQAAGLKIFSPSAAAARIEGSKSWAKEIMKRCGAPTAEARTFTGSEDALAFALSRPEGSFVIKADGLAAGKGVLLPDTHQEATNAIVSILDGNAFGEAGESLLIEERTSGPEVSVFAFIQGEYVSPEVAACDYKRVNDGDEGPNTGGMGAYTPPEFWTPELAIRVRKEIFEPVVRQMVKDGSSFNGMLYAGLMITESGPSVIEFNARFGDPECEVLMPRLESDLAEICLAVAEGRLAETEVKWGDSAHVCVVMTSGGYPGKYQTGQPISGLASDDDALVFHAGTTTDSNGQVVTAGGRVLVAVGSGPDIKSARDDAYSTAEKVSFDREHHRMDIALRAIPTDQTIETGALR
jgi:phosphoribosylamine--glycine ligase